jgi:transposase
VQAAQLTEARAEFRWLADGSQMVQQQALRDFARAMANFFAGTHRKPTWRKAGQDEGFRIVAVKASHIRRLSRKRRSPLGGRVNREPQPLPLFRVEAGIPVIQGGEDVKVRQF